VNNEPVPSVPPSTPVCRFTKNVVTATAKPVPTLTVVAPPSTWNVLASWAPVTPAKLQSVTGELLENKLTASALIETGPSVASRCRLDARTSAIELVADLNERTAAQPPVRSRVAPSVPACTVIPVNVNVNNEPVPSVPPSTPVCRFTKNVVTATAKPVPTLTVV